MTEFQTSVAKVSVDFNDKINILLGDSVDRFKFKEGFQLLYKSVANISQNIDNIPSYLKDDIMAILQQVSEKLPPALHSYSDEEIVDNYKNLLE